MAVRELALPAAARLDTLRPPIAKQDASLRLLDQMRAHAADDRRGAEAVVSDAQSLTHAELLARVEAGAAGLLAAGIGDRATVGVSIADEIDHLVAALALLVVGTRHITLASHDSASVKDAIGRRAGVTHVVSAEAAAELPGPVHLQWPVAADSTAGWGSGGQGTVYLKTSGTTGDANIVPFDEEQLGDQALRHPEYATDRLLRLASIEHNNSKRHRLYCVLMGGTNVFRPRSSFDVAAFCKQYRVTCLDISRMHASDLAVAGDAGLSGIKIRTGGSSVPIDVRRSVEQHVTKQLFVRYASTETGAIAMAGPGQHDDDEVVGAPLPGVELQIIDDEERVVPRGSTGHIRIRAAGVATGYLNSPEDTARRFRDGWFYPGDMGRVRADGCLIIAGRRDDMMILNGLNIFPVEIERVLERHPAVRVAAALPIASKVHGQIPVAAVELNEGAEVSPAELMTYAREHLALRTPRRILIVPALPRNSQGKLMRRELATAFAPRSHAG